ncbi:unnamed protein product [Gulo gulo]|uniref:Uncharacterized protein n=1 Tax=Gulo gulo TaxID=48420 RepID=A0A9X9PSY1_GULGU|nr:unnamed protein product [Gulo gulo]
MIQISCIGSLKVCVSVCVCVCVHLLSGGGVGVAWEARKERLCLHYPRHHHHTPSQRTHHLMGQEMGVERGPARDSDPCETGSVSKTGSNAQDEGYLFRRIASTARAPRPAG